MDDSKKYQYIKGVVKFLREKTTANGKQMLMFAVVGDPTEVCSYFPSANEERFSVSLYSGCCF